MHESHELNGLPTDAGVEDRLRGVRLAAPRLDRDRLMYLAGRASVAPARRSRLWPTVAAGSWAVCAVLAGLLATRSPEVVVETRVVTRTVEVPAAGQGEWAGPVAARQVPGSAHVGLGSATGADLWSLDVVEGPLTVLSSRPSLRRSGEALALAEAPAAAGDATPRSPASYGDLRRELMQDRGNEAAAGLLRWF